MSEEEKEIVAETAPALTAALVSGGLSVIGKHPILLNHTYLELAVKGQGVADISLLAQYPNLM